MVRPISKKADSNEHCRLEFIHLQFCFKDDQQHAHAENQQNRDTCPGGGLNGCHDYKLNRSCDANAGPQFLVAKLGKIGNIFTGSGDDQNLSRQLGKIGTEMHRAFQYQNALLRRFDT